MTDEQREARMAYYREREAAIRSHLDNARSGESMIALSMASDAQELIARGMLKEANELLNDLKMVIEISLGARDEHGRHIKSGVRYE